MKLRNAALNRALLARQFLLERHDISVRDAVAHLVGLQAQATMPPYYGLWSRIAGFDAHEVGRMLNDREVVRMTLMRGTVHLVTVSDALLLRPLVQPVIERSFNGMFRRRTAGIDLAALSRATREILESGPRTGREIARQLLERGSETTSRRSRSASASTPRSFRCPPAGCGAAVVRRSTRRLNRGRARRCSAIRASTRWSCVTCGRSAPLR